MSDRVSVHVAGGVADVRLNRPEKMNALDPAMFDDADDVVIDRAVNRHCSFGLGIHRCLGSNLARMELRVAMECWLARIPDFSLVEGASVEWNGGQVRGPRAVPLELGTRP